MEAGSHAVNEPMVGSEERQLDSIGSAKLIEDVREVGFDGVLGNRRSCGNFPVRVTSHNRSNDLDLPACETKRLRFPTSRLDLSQVRDDSAESIVTEPIIPRHYRPDAFEQHVGRGVFQDNPAYS